MAKTIEKWTDIAPTPFGDRLDPERPVIARIVELAAGVRVQPHRHRRGQLIHAPRGPMRVVTAVGNWSVPLDQAVWVPGDVEHAVLARVPLSVHALFIAPEAAGELPTHCQVLLLSPLMRELIGRAVALGDDYPAQGPGQRMMAVILDELATLAPTPLHLPMAADVRVRKVMDGLMADPADNRGLEDWAGVAGATARTLARRFVAETGLSFGQWRARLRLLESVERLQRGQPVTRVAMELGYRSPSAFTAMFRRELGMPPGALKR